MVLHLTSLRKPLRAITALYPFLFVSDKSTNAHKPAPKGTFGDVPEPTITDEDWKNISPSGLQFSEAPMPVGGVPTPRNKWLMSIFHKGSWLSTMQPDGDLAAVDPFTRIHADFAPTYLIHGSEDNVPGRSEKLVRRAGDELKAAGVKEVEVEILNGGGHLFDHFPGVTDEQWRAVVRGLEWLVDHVRGSDEKL